MSKIAIIGSGLGGLTAGCLLAEKGHAVTIFESNTVPGGYISGFRRKGFYFESGTLSFESSRQVFGAMKKLGVYDRIEFVPQPIHVLAAEYDFVPRDFEQYKQGLLAAFPGDRERLARYFAAVDPMVKAMLKLIRGKGFAMLPGVLSVLILYMKYRGVSISDFNARFFDRESRICRLLDGVGYPEMSVWILGAAFSTFLHDYWTVKGGMQSWADALAEKFRSLGGELRLKTPVTKIITRDGAAAGVEADGKEQAADWVISACDFKKTFLNLLDNPSLVPAPWLERVRKTAVSEGIATVYLGLNMAGDKLREKMKAPHLSFFDEQPGADVKNAADPDYFAKCSIGLYSPSLHDPKLAPAGKSSLMIQAVAPFHWQDNWGGGDREKYGRLKERMRRDLIAKAAKVIPELEAKIEYVDAATPLTYERYTGNSDGATSAWSWNPANKFYKSAMGTTVDTPVKRLLIGSCWATQIGGVPGALGAAQKCAKRIG